MRPRCPPQRQRKRLLLQQSSCDDSKGRLCWSGSIHRLCQAMPGRVFRARGANLRICILGPGKMWLPLVWSLREKVSRQKIRLHRRDSEQYHFRRPRKTFYTVRKSRFWRSGHQRKDQSIRRRWASVLGLKPKQPKKGAPGWGRHMRSKDLKWWMAFEQRISYNANSNKIL